MPICLPIHVLDRELDAVILTSVIASSQGHTVVFGDEHNISGLYPVAKKLTVIRHGSATQDPTRAGWNKAILKNKGKSIHYNLEGVNNIPHTAEEVAIGEACLRKFRIRANYQSDSISIEGKTLTAEDWKEQTSKYYFKNKLEQDYFMGKHGDALLNEGIFSISGDIRDPLTSELGSKIFSRRAINIRGLIAAPFVLVSDNFSIDHFGMNGKGHISRESHLRVEGLSEAQIRLYNERAKDVRLSEIEARSRFVQLLIHIATLMPQVVFVVRPHPVCDPTFLNSALSGLRNVIVLYRDSIYPWIYASACVLHSGCTTGYESAKACRPTFDISNLIGSDKPSISKYFSISFSSIDQLCNAIRTSVGESGFLGIKMRCHSRNDSMKRTPIDERLASIPKEGLPNLVDDCSSTAAAGLKGLAFTISNTEDLISSPNFYKALFNEINNGETELTQFRAFECKVNDFSSYAGKALPVQTKSRFLYFEDVMNRVLDCMIALRLDQSLVPDLRKISHNTYMLSMIEKKHSSQGKFQALFSHQESNTNEDYSYAQNFNCIVNGNDPSLKSCGGNIIHDQQQISHGRQYFSDLLYKNIYSPWPANAVKHAAKSKQIHTILNSYAKLDEISVSSIADLLKAKKSNRVYILGCGPSINKITTREWRDISMHDSISVNNFIAHAHISTYNLYEACQPHHIAFLQAVILEKGCHGNLFLNLRHLLCNKNLRKNDLLSFKTINPFVIKPSNEHSFKSILRELLRSESCISFHARGSLSIALSLAVALGYNEIILTGIELDTNNYFFQENISSLFSSALRDKLISSFESELKEAALSGYDMEGAHLTVAKSASRTLPMDKLIQAYCGMIENSSPIRFYLHSYCGLLKDKLPIAGSS